MNWKPNWKSTPLLDNFIRGFQYSVDSVIDKGYKFNTQSELNKKLRDL